MIVRSIGANMEPLIRPDTTSMPSCSPLSRPSLTVAAEARPALTASARVGGRRLRSGRKKACGAVEQKKEPKCPEKELATSATMRERPNHCLSITVNRGSRMQVDLRPNLLSVRVHPLKLDETSPPCSPYVGTRTIPSEAKLIAEHHQRRAVSLHEHLRTAKFTQVHDIEVR